MHHLLALVWEHLKEVNESCRYKGICYRPGKGFGLGRNLFDINIYILTSAYAILLLQGQEFISSNIELISCFERCSHNPFLRFHSKVDLVNGTQDLVNFANCGLLSGQTVFNVEPHHLFRRIPCFPSRSAH